MKLFICITPLQLYIANRIIEELNLNIDMIEICYIGDEKRKANKEPLSILKSKGVKITFIYLKDYGSLKIILLPFYYFYISIKFFFCRYTTIYMASIDMLTAQIIVSRNSNAKLFTFDDGTANIFQSSGYYIEKKNNFQRKIINTIFCNKYNLIKLKRKSQLHYTIYENTPNIIENKKLIPLFRNDFTNSQIAITSAPSCNVFLGTAYNQIFLKKVNTKKVFEKCCSFILSKNMKTYYIPHPVGGYDFSFRDVSTIESENMAEFEIQKLLNKYAYVNIFGFMSSTQFNLASNKRINNYVFFHSQLVPAYRNAFVENVIPDSFVVIDI